MKPVTSEVRSVRAPVLLALGDLGIFTGFAVLGRAAHELPPGASPVASAAIVIASFAASWLAVCAWLGGFRSSVVADRRRLLARAAIAWPIACPIGLLLRAAMLGQAIALPFALVTFGFNGALLLAWRLVFNWIVNR
jgi:hypothetical protein